MEKFKKILRSRIESALDEGYAKHIPLTSDYLAEKLTGMLITDNESPIVMERLEAAEIIEDRITTDNNLILSVEPMNYFGKFILNQQDEAMKTAIRMLRNPVPMLTPMELRKVYEIQQHNYDISDIINELDIARDDYIEEFEIDKYPVTNKEIDEMAWELRKILDRDADVNWSSARNEAVSEVLRKRKIL